jgi:hypothetical protein
VVAAGHKTASIGPHLGINFYNRYSKPIPSVCMYVRTYFYVDYNLATRQGNAYPVRLELTLAPSRRAMIPSRRERLRAACPFQNGDRNTLSWYQTLDSGTEPLPCPVSLFRAIGHCSASSLLAKFSLRIVEILALAVPVVAHFSHH